MLVERLIGRLILHRSRCKHSTVVPSLGQYSSFWLFQASQSQIWEASHRSYSSAAAALQQQPDSDPDLVSIVYTLVYRGDDMEDWTSLSTNPGVYLVRANINMRNYRVDSRNCETLVYQRTSTRGKPPSLSVSCIILVE